MYSIYNHFPFLYSLSSSVQLFLWEEKWLAFIIWQTMDKIHVWNAFRLDEKVCLSSLIYFFDFELNVVYDHFVHSISFLFWKNKSELELPNSFLEMVFTNLSNDGLNLFLCSWIIFLQGRYPFLSQCMPVLEVLKDF